MQKETSPTPAVPAPAASALQPAWLPWLRAAGRLDALTWLALICIVIGWFLLDTLVVTAGPARHAVRFYEIAALIHNPMQLFVGIQGSHVLEVIVFALVCVAALATPLAPYLRNARAAWLAYLVPLLLMLVCGAWLYARTSGDFVDTPADAGALASDVLRFANDLLHRGSAPIVRHVSVGAGSYLALIGCLFLAFNGMRHYRASPAAL
jgi:hypothetical protein